MRSTHRSFGLPFIALAALTAATASCAVDIGDEDAEDLAETSQESVLTSRILRGASGRCVTATSSTTTAMQPCVTGSAAQKVSVINVTTYPSSDEGPVRRFALELRFDAYGRCLKFDGTLATCVGDRGTASTAIAWGRAKRADGTYTYLSTYDVTRIGQPYYQYGYLTDPNAENEVPRVGPLSVGTYQKWSER